jgi:hypothetical protein
MHPKEENLAEKNPYGFRNPYKEIINEENSSLFMNDIL